MVNFKQVKKCCELLFIYEVAQFLKLLKISVKVIKHF